MNHPYAPFYHSPVAQNNNVELFHESTKSTKVTSLKKAVHIQNYLHDYHSLLESSRHYKTYPHCPKVILPKPQKIEKSFDDVLDKRESCRQFTSNPLSLEHVSCLVNSLRVRWSGFLEQFPDIAVKKRVYPSAGGLYPVETYILAFRVDGLERAVYHVNVDRHELSRLTHLDPKINLKKIIGDCGQAALALAITAVLPRTCVKYGALGYRFALLEGGIVSEHLALAASALDLASLFWGGYHDDAVHDLLGADGVEETIINLLFIGRKGNESKGQHHDH